jgi:hypothetical protein
MPKMSKSVQFKPRVRPMVGVFRVFRGQHLLLNHFCVLCVLLRPFHADPWPKTRQIFPPDLIDLPGGFTYTCAPFYL